jgi:hypothetical protein
MTSPLNEALARLDRARGPADLFGTDTAEAARTYRSLARLLHPDATGGRTTGDFTRLNALWRGYNGGGAVTITTRRHAYRLGAKRASGDLAELYDASYDDPRGRRAVIKLPCASFPRTGTTDSCPTCRG